MNLYISRGGGVEGPFPLEQVRAMVNEGGLSPTDLAAAPGDADWKPVSDWITSSDSAASPPPMPAQAPSPAWDAPFSIDGKAPSGTAGKTVKAVVDEVAAGGRFVMYPYVISIIILSFRRSSPIIYLPPGHSGGGAAIGWSLVSMALGWWGIPWGLFFTIGALWRNACGGIDVTEPVLAPMLGPQRADALLRQRPKPPAGGLWLLRGLIAAPLVLIVLTIGGLVLSGMNSESEQAKLPGYREYESANQYLGRPKSTEGNGNIENAKRAGSLCASMMQSWMQQASSDSPKNITAWCELHPKRVLFLVRVPDLRKYNDEAKEEICHAAWSVSQFAARDLELAPDAEIAVAVRGLAIYDRMMTGRLISPSGEEDENIEAALKAAIRKTDRKVIGGDRFAGYFVPPDP